MTRSMIAPVLQNYKFYDKISEKSVEENVNKSSDKEIVNVDIIVNPDSEEISDDDNSRHVVDEYCPEKLELAKYYKDSEMTAFISNF